MSNSLLLIDLNLTCEGPLAERCDILMQRMTEWEQNIDKLKAYGGDLPHPQDILASYMKLLDDNSRAYALDKIADAGHVGQYAGDARISLE